MSSAVQETLPFESLYEVATASPWCRRWTRRQPSWRHTSEGGFDPRRYEVAPLDEGTAKAFVIDHHYAASYPSATYRFGLYNVSAEARQLCGVAVYGPAAGARVLTRTLPDLEPNRESLVLSRFVLTDQCPGNSETWFLARTTRELLGRGVRGIVSFADPVPRQDIHGAMTAIGHVGTIYQAANSIYTGRAAARTLMLLPDGTVLHERAAQKVRRQEPGHRYVEERLIALGAPVPRAGCSPADWLREALQSVGVRRLRHRGAHRYVFRLGRNRKEREGIRLGWVGLPAPKVPDRVP
ncbi:Mom family adenine methylcarbamoylation protein [Streptomyces goshikiensis]|uniref:Mom family adenine methylcarbamoylation protein n=1 Tax=Streptomyces goshikiensis TaxID=1942 RepID=UPI00367C9C89